MASIKNPYAVLGVPNDSDLATCKKAYKKLARSCHPDLVSGKEEQFLLISEAMKLIESGYKAPVLNYTKKRRNLKHVDLMHFDVY